MAKQGVELAGCSWDWQGIKSLTNNRPPERGLTTIPVVAKGEACPNSDKLVVQQGMNWLAAEGNVGLGAGLSLRGK